jgi:hypothetical protein
LQKKRKHVVFDGLGFGLAERVAVAVARVALGVAEPFAALCVAVADRDADAEAVAEVVGDELPTAFALWSTAAAPAGDDETAGRIVDAAPRAGALPPPLSPATPTAAAAATAAAPPAMNVLRRRFGPAFGRAAPRDAPERRACGAPLGAGSGSQTALIAGP